MAKILMLRKQGMTHKQIADKLGIHINTVGNHLKSAGMMGKLNSAKP
jgi:DNA-binding CsgD family transcriptional regulator